MKNWEKLQNLGEKIGESLKKCLGNIYIKFGESL